MPTWLNEPRVIGPQGAGAKRKQRAGEQLFLMDTTIAFRAHSHEQAKRIADELAAEIRESHRVVLAHVCLVERDNSDD